MTSSDPFLDLFQEWVELYMHRSMRSFFRYARENGLSMPQIGTLFQIQKKGAWAVSDVSEDLNVTSAAASQMIDRLVQQELITRSEDPTDRRAKRITLTDKGRQMLKESIRARQSWLGNLAAALSPEEKVQVRAALQILVEKGRLLESQSWAPGQPGRAPENEPKI